MGRPLSFIKCGRRVTVPGVERMKAQMYSASSEVRLQDFRDGSRRARRTCARFQAAIRIVDAYFDWYWNVHPGFAWKYSGRPFDRPAQPPECVADNAHLRFAIEAEALSKSCAKPAPPSSEDGHRGEWPSEFAGGVRSG